MKQYAAIFFYLCLFFSKDMLYAQQRKMDSLWSVYKNTSKPDTVRLQALNNIAWSSYRNNPDTAILLAKEQVILAQSVAKGKGKKWEAKAYSTIAACYNIQSDFLSALDYYSQSLKVRQEIEDKRGIGTCYGNIGFVYREMSDFPKALEYYLKALKTDEESGNKEGIAFCYRNIGLVYQDIFNYPKSLEYHKKGLAMQKELNNPTDEAFSYLNIGSVYFAMKEHNLARDYYIKALHIYQKQDDYPEMASIYNNLGLLCVDQEDYQQAWNYYALSLQLKQHGGRRQGIATSLINISDLCLKLKDYRKAILYADSALLISREIGDIDNERLAYNCLASSYANKGDYERAFENHVKFKTLTDSIFNAENSKQLGDMKTRFEVEKKEAELNAKAEARQVMDAEEKKRQLFVIYAVIGVLAIVLIFSLLLYKRFRLTRRQKQIIEMKSRETEEQKHLVEEKQKEIIESITYAKRLQEAILPPLQFITAHVPNNFVLYRPKDIVAGDFYWAEAAGGLFFIAAADSTGHGVPGAMVSVVCSGALNRAVNEFHLRETGKILDKTRELVLETFSKSESDVKDGMDISLLCIDVKSNRAMWSGANNPLLYVRNEKIEEITADKQPIGKTDRPVPFTTHELDCRDGTVFYLFTDGYADQFGGPKGKKFMYKRLMEMLRNNSSLSPAAQKDILEETFSSWKESNDQVDDVCVIGIMI